MYIGTNYYNYYNNVFNKNYNSLLGQTGNELKTTLSNVSSINKSSDYFNSNALQYVKDMKSGSAALKSSLNALTGGSAFKNAAVSSNTDVLTVKTATGFNTSHAQNTSVFVDQIATAQKNEGSALQAQNKVGVGGYYQFALDSNGKSYQFSIEVSANDTNKTLQQKMADAVNARNIGFSASVSTDAKNNTSTLSIQSKNTGASASNQFTLRDVTGDAVTKTGVQNLTQAAQDAQFRVNGGSVRTSQSNTIDIGNGLNVTLLKASDKAVNITLGTDKDLAYSKVQEFADSYNKLYEVTLNNPKDLKTNRLFTQMVNTSKTYTSTLGNIGIGFDKDGYMTVDKDVLGKAAEDGRLDRFFTENRNTNYGFTNQLSRIADDVNRNTGKYISQSTVAESLTGSNTGYYELFSKAPYTSLMNIGMLFDFMY